MEHWQPYSRQDALADMPFSLGLFYQAVPTLLNKSWTNDVGWLILTPLRLTVAAFLERVRAVNHSHGVKSRVRHQETGLSMASRLSPAHQHNWCSQPMAKEAIQLSFTCNKVDVKEVEMFCLCQAELKLLPLHVLGFLKSELTSVAQTHLHCPSYIIDGRSRPFCWCTSLYQC